VKKSFAGLPLLSPNGNWPPVQDTMVRGDSVARRVFVSAYAGQVFENNDEEPLRLQDGN
jgi:hypothetical protein